jgi:hypothetical protein
MGILNFRKSIKQKAQKFQLKKAGAHLQKNQTNSRVADVTPPKNRYKPPTPVVEI